MMSPVHFALFRSLKVRRCDSAVLMCTYLCPHFFCLKTKQTFLTSWKRCVMMSPVQFAQFPYLKVRHCDGAVLMCTCAHIFLFKKTQLFSVPGKDVWWCCLYTLHVSVLEHKFQREKSANRNAPCVSHCNNPAMIQLQKVSEVRNNIIQTPWGAEGFPLYGSQSVSATHVWKCSIGFALTGPFWRTIMTKVTSDHWTEGEGGFCIDMESFLMSEVGLQDRLSKSQDWLCSYET